MRGREIVGVVLMGVSFSLVHAADGRRPIWEPTIITEPGSYVVTRNIGAPFCAGPVSIDIQASNVDVDLNGFTLYCGEPVIRAEGVTHVTVHDGKIYGTHEDGITFDNVRNFSIRRVELVSNEDCTLQLLNVSDGVVEETLIQQPGACVLWVIGSNVEVRRSVFHGNSLVSCTGCSITESGFRGSGISLEGVGNLVKGNVFTAGAAMLIGGSGNVIVDNVVSGSTFFEGLRIFGDRNHIEGNVSTGNAAFGIVLTGNDNVYRGNSARGNQGVGCTNPAGNVNFCDSGTGNTSHGDNYMPSQM